MAANFLHGVETIQILQGPRPVSEVKTAVIGLIGIAPTGPAQQLILVRNDVEAAQFGEMVPGFNIPAALSHIFAQGAGTVLVVNVFDEATHTTQVTDEEKTVTAGRLKLSAAPIGALTIKTQAGGATTYVKGTDYNIDAFGNFVVVPGRIANGTVLKFSFKKLNGAAVTDAHLVGSVAVNGTRTGTKVFDLAANSFGFKPKILIAPGYSAKQAVATELIAAAEKFRGITYIDSTVGATVAQAIADRGQASAFFTSNKRAILAYPYVKAYDPATEADGLFPYSSFLAGVTAATDNEFGYWYSPSNKPIAGITGLERNISSDLSDATSEANQLNEAGIMTVFNAFGTGFKTWGNSNASFPTNANPDRFISIVRVSDQVDEAMELAALQFIDGPINTPLIDDIRESGNSFMRVLIGRGALMEGSKVVFDPADNTPTQIAAGNITFRKIFMGPTPAERITYKSVLDISLLKSVK